MLLKKRDLSWLIQFIKQMEVVSISKFLPLELVMEEVAPSTAPVTLFYIPATFFEISIDFVF